MQEHTATQLPPASRYLSRDLSWLKFNQRVLDQAEKPHRSPLEQLRFLGISAANLDEFFMVRVGHIYNHIDYQRTWPNQLGLAAAPFLHQLLQEAQQAFQRQHACLQQLWSALPEATGSTIAHDPKLLREDLVQLQGFFRKQIFPTLTPIRWNPERPLPPLLNNVLVLAVVAQATPRAEKQIFLIQIPPNLPRLHQLKQGQKTILVPIEVLLEENIALFLQDMHLCSTTLFRVTRNSNFFLEESDDVEAAFVEELKQKLKKRNHNRVVKIELSDNPDPWIVALLREHCDLQEESFFQVPAKSMMHLAQLQELVQHYTGAHHPPVPPMIHPLDDTEDLFASLKKQDLLLHHPYNSIDVLLRFLRAAADDSQVVAIKITLYRLAPNSSVVDALVKAAAQGKHVVVLIEVTARFDEEHNLEAAQELEQAGCLVIYGTAHRKTHAKMMMIVRHDEGHVTRYVHFSSGNYNEDTAKGYTDVSLMTTDEGCADDVAAFFNALTSHTSDPQYQHLITAPTGLRQQLIAMIEQEVLNAAQGQPSGIVIKVNALEDKSIIDALYAASQAGVPIQLIVRGICCLIPQSPGLSENITVRSIVGNFLEHARIFYFHHQGNPNVYMGSADLMLRSFDRRVEALIQIKDTFIRQQLINILAYNLRDNVNSYCMQPDGCYVPLNPGTDPPFDLHKALYQVSLADLQAAQLFA